MGDVPYYLQAPDDTYQSPNPAGGDAPASDPSDPSNPDNNRTTTEGDQTVYWHKELVGWKNAPDPSGATDDYGNPKQVQVPVYKWVPERPKDKSGSGSGAQPRNDALTAAMDNLKSYLSASAAADARRQASFDAFQKLSQWALPAGSKTSPADAPGGPGQAFAASIGLKNFNPVPIQTQMVDPSALAQAAPIDPVVQQMLAGVTAAG